MPAVGRACSPLRAAACQPTRSGSSQLQLWFSVKLKCTGGDARATMQKTPLANQRGGVKLKLDYFLRRMNSIAAPPRAARAIVVGSGTSWVAPKENP